MSASPRPRVVPLRELLERADPSKVSVIRTGLSATRTSDLVEKFRARFRSQRLSGLLIAEELAERGVPPVFWHDPRSTAPLTATQEFDLLTYDLRYLQPIYWRSPWPIRVTAFSKMLSGKWTDRQFHGTVEWIWNGNKQMWWTKGKLAVPPEREAGCMFLGKEAVLKHREQLADKREKVYQAISADVGKSRTTVHYGLDERKETLKRRMSLWWIAELTGWGSSDVARVFKLLHDREISRQAVAKQLDIIHAVLADAGIRRSRKRWLKVG